MRFYVGAIRRCEAKYNLFPEIKHFCLAPTLTPYAPQGAKILLDSGAYGDVRRGRFTFNQGLERQLAFETKHQFISERIASYDLLIDEQMRGDRRIKSRWAEKAGWKAVDETIAAAEFLCERRESLAPRQLVLGCQGVNIDQYETCVSAIQEIANPEDCIGLGGWCIIGQQRRYLRLFGETLQRILPLIAAKGHPVHLFGVTHIPALRHFALKCRDICILASVDSARFSYEPSRGFLFDESTGKSYRYMGKQHTWEKIKENIIAGHRFISRIEEWKPMQLDLFEGGPE